MEVTYYLDRIGVFYVSPTGYPIYIEKTGEFLNDRKETNCCAYQRRQQS